MKKIAKRGLKLVRLTVADLSNVAGGFDPKNPGQSDNPSASGMPSWSCLEDTCPATVRCPTDATRACTISTSWVIG